MCGEETSLLNSLEGLVPWPRERPPFPTQKGLWGLPTVINNVETFCSVPAILERGADWYRELGRGESAGTKLYSVSGRVAIPGPYELPLGATARELIEGAGGGALPGRSIKGYTIGGISGGLLAAEHLDMPLDYAAPRQHGFGLGSGGVVVFDDACCVVDLVRTCMLFYEAESCGKCFPCRVGTVRLRERLDALTGRADPSPNMMDEFNEIGAAMSANSACGLGQAAPLVLHGLVRFFGEELEAHRQGVCPAGVCHFI